MVYQIGYRKVKRKDRSAKIEATTIEAKISEALENEAKDKAKPIMQIRKAIGKKWVWW